MFSDCGTYWYYESGIEGSFFKLTKDDYVITHSGFDGTVDAWLKEGVIVEVGLLINI